MTSPPANLHPEQPHLVSLVLQSKKALQHGEQLCSRANSLSNASAQSAIDALALDAKVKWITDAVIEQLKLAAGVAKYIKEKRAQLEKQVQEWDSVRIKRTDALDGILESLGLQFVPPDFHHGSSDSSLFGSQHSDDEAGGALLRSPAATLRNDLSPKDKTDRSKWKTLRDFVDERGIEDALESMESDRTALDDMLATTDDYPESLSNTISSIRDALPVLTSVLSIEDILMSQENYSTNMARHLESLAGHYDQMAGALRESEAGEAFGEEDLQAMNRDTDELPSIMAELEEGVRSIEASHEKLLAANDMAQQQLNVHQGTLDDLEELGEIMTEMLQRQEHIEGDCEEHLEVLQQHLLTLDDLHHRFTSYQTAFNKLIIEIARRQQYRQAAEAIVRGMRSQLEAMEEEERQVRNAFNAEHGAHLPADICLCIENPPTKWDIGPWNGDEIEGLPEIPNDLLAQASDRLGTVDGSGLPGTESL